MIKVASGGADRVPYLVVTNLTRETCDELAKIPMHCRVESLNVSVSAGICLFEARRQRGG